MRMFIASVAALCFVQAYASENRVQSDEHIVNVALKTNVLADAFLNANIGTEVAVASNLTIDVTSDINTWPLSHKRRWKHWYIQPELRRWLSSHFNGHFWGVHAFTGIYNLGNLKNNFTLLGTNFSNLSDYRYEGWMIGCGVTYGYAWHFDKHWSLEGEIGIGYAWSRYRTYNTDDWGKKINGARYHNYVGPTKLAINLVYTF